MPMKNHLDHQFLNKTKEIKDYWGAPVNSGFSNLSRAYNVPQSADYHYLKLLILILKKQKLPTLSPGTCCPSLSMYRLTLLIGIKARDELSYVNDCLVKVYHRQGLLL